MTCISSVGQLCRFPEDVVGDRHLSDVVKKGAASYDIDLVFGDSHLSGDGDGKGCDAASSVPRFQRL